MCRRPLLLWVGIEAKRKFVFSNVCVRLKCREKGGCLLNDFLPSNGIRHFERYQATNWFCWRKRKWKSEDSPTNDALKLEMQCGNEINGKMARNLNWHFYMPTIKKRRQMPNKMVVVKSCYTPKSNSLLFMQIQTKSQRINQNLEKSVSAYRWNTTCMRIQLICDACDKIEFNFRRRVECKMCEKKVCRKSHSWWFMRRNVARLILLLTQISPINGTLGSSPSMRMLTESSHRQL